MSKRATTSISCTKCGAQLHILPGQVLADCPACGTQNSINVETVHIDVCPKCHRSAYVMLAVDALKEKHVDKRWADGLLSPPTHPEKPGEFSFHSTIGYGSKRGWWMFIIGILLIFLELQLGSCMGREGDSVFNWESMFCFYVPAIALIIVGIIREVIVGEKKMQREQEEQAAYQDWNGKNAAYQQALERYQERSLHYNTVQQAWKKLLFCRRDETFFDPDYPGEHAQGSGLGKLLEAILKKESGKT